MWPWEHVVVGYLVFSVLSHLVGRRPPRSDETVAVVVASLFPDLVDKPLAWSFEVVTTGYGPAHSVFVAVPLVVAAATALLAVGRPWLGAAFGVGYLLHLPGDVLHNATGGGTIDPAIVLWPVRTYDGAGASAGFVRESILRIDHFRTEVLAGSLSLYTRVQLALLALAMLLWIYDGTPLLRESVRRTRALLAK